jgi:hypothetical protein
VLFAFAGVPMPLASSAEVGPRQQCQALCQRILLALRFIKNAGVSRAQCSNPGALENLAVTQRRRGEYAQHASKLRQTITKFWMVMRASCAPELCGNPDQSSDEMEDKQQQLQQIDTAVRRPGLGLPQPSSTAAVAASAFCATSVPVTGLSGGTIGEAEYVALHLRVAKALQNHWHMSEALQVAHQDWFSDLHRGPSSQPGVPICCQPDEEAARQRNRLDFPGFFEALYELADHWTHGVSPLEFDAFLSAIFAAITVGSAPGGIEEVDGALGTAARVRLRGLEYNHTTAYYEFKEIDEISPMPLESLLPAISSPDTQNVQPETGPVMAPSEADVCEIEHNQDGCDPLRNSALEQAEEWIAHARLYSTPPPPPPPTPPGLSIAPPTLQIVSNSDIKPAHTHGNSSRRRRRRHRRCKAPKSGVVEQTCLTSSKRSSTATHATQRDQPGGWHIQRGGCIHSGLRCNHRALLWLAEVPLLDAVWNCLVAGRQQCRYQPGRNLSAKAQPRLNDTRQRLTDNAQQLQEAASNVHASATSVDSTSKMAKLFPPLRIQPAPHKQQQNRCRCRLRRKSPSPPPSTMALGEPSCRGGPMGATHCCCRRCRCLLPTSVSARPHKSLLVRCMSPEISCTAVFATDALLQGMCNSN